MRDLVGKVAVVTGAASGIGNAMAYRFAEEGMRVVLADIDAERLIDAEKRLRELGKDIITVRCDVSKWDEVESLAQQTIAAYGEVHVVCNNAGVGTLGRCWELEPADWARVLGVNLWGVIHGVHAFVPLLIQQGTEGHIVNTASIAGFIPQRFVGSYDVSKYGVVALSEVLHNELIDIGSRVSVSVLSPGLVNTNIVASEDRRVGGQHRHPEVYAALENAIRDVGISPKSVADRVIDAIREERFYVFTHPDSEGMIRRRMDGILAGRPPSQHQ